MHNLDFVYNLIEAAYEREHQGDIAGGLQLSLQALGAANASDDPQSQANARLAVARFRFRLGQYDLAYQLAQEALALSSSESQARAGALMTLGMCACEANTPAEADGWYREAAALARQLADPLLLLRALHNLGTGVYLPRGQFQLALASGQEACSIARENGLLDWLNFPLVTVAWAAQLSGQRLLAQAALHELHQVTQAESTPRAYYHYLTACLALDEGDLQSARPHLDLGYTFAERSGDPGLGAEVRLELSRWYRLAGDLPAAWNWSQDAVTHARRVKYPHKLGACLAEHGRVALERQLLVEAEADEIAAIDILSGLQANFDLAYARLLLAYLYQRRRHPLAALAWQQAASLILEGGFALLLERDRGLVFNLAAEYLGHRQKNLAVLAGDLIEVIQKAPALPLLIHTLGALEVKVGHRSLTPAALKQRRAGELLALLVITPRHCLLVEQVAEALSPGQEPVHSSTVLHHATSALRRLLEPDLPDRRFPSHYLELSDDQLYLHLPEGSWVDFEAFSAACLHKDWQQALSLYSGDLLSDFRYAEWTALQREALSEQFHQALLALAQARLADQRWNEALNLAQRLLALDPWQEAAALIAMRAYLGMDNLPAAVRLYQKLQVELEKELGIQPSEELQQLYRSFPAMRR